MSIKKMLKSVINGALPASNWEFITSSGHDASGGEGIGASASYENIYIRQKIGKASAPRSVLTYLGAGPMVSVGIPFTVTEAKEYYPCHGRISVGPGQSGLLGLMDFSGMTIAFSTSAGGPLAVQSSVFFFGVKIGVNQLSGLNHPTVIATNIIKTAKAVGVVQGLISGLHLGGGVSVQIGYKTVS